MNFFKFLFIFCILGFSFTVVAMDNTDVIDENELLLKGRLFFKKIKTVVEDDFIDLIVNTNPTTGFDWQISDFDDQIITVSQKKYFPTTKAKDLCGAGSVLCMKIRSLKSGKTQFNFRYMRNWEGGEIADRFVFYIEVDENKNIHIDRVEKIEVEYGL